MLAIIIVAAGRDVHRIREEDPRVKQLVVIKPPVVVPATDRLDDFGAHHKAARARNRRPSCETP